MDPLTHIFFTRKFISSKPNVILAGIGSDTPFYLTYPAWVIASGQLHSAIHHNNWPEPPRWLEIAHHALHSIPMLVLLAIGVRLVTNRWPKDTFRAWLLHILIDIPTHSRAQWGPRFLWPFSNFAVDGVSWVDLAFRWVRRF